MKTDLGRILAIVGGFITLIATLLPWVTYSYFNGNGSSGSYVYSGVAFFGASSITVYLFGLFWLTSFALPRKVYAILGFGWGILALMLALLAASGVVGFDVATGSASAYTATIETGVYISMPGPIIMVLGSALSYLEVRKAMARGSKDREPEGEPSNDVFGVLR